MHPKHQLPRPLKPAQLKKTFFSQYVAMGWAMPVARPV